MESSTPRLLVTLKQRPEVGAAIDRALPEIPWAYDAVLDSGHWSHVEALLVGSLTRENASFDASKTPSLRFVQRAYTGLDGFPFAWFPPTVQVAGNVGAFAPFVSEHALALALAAGRDLRQGQAMIAAGRLRPAPEMRILYESTVVILGFGEIGREIARKTAAAGAHVVGLNRTGRSDPACERMFASDRLQEAVALGDFVFEVRPLTKLTAGTIGPAELDAMRPDAVFVNVGRAGTVNEEALFLHLRAHPSFRAATDVWWAEDYALGTISPRFPFAELPNFFGTPHCAGGGAGARSADARALSFAIENLARFFREGRPLHLADRNEYEG
jgi:phosphoglycerate dehydrogenase-like enzyme